MVKDPINSKAKGKRETDLDGLPARIIEHRLTKEEHCLSRTCDPHRKRHVCKCIGRKNFVLIESYNVAKASAVLYSLVETAKANQLITYKYFELLLTEIPKYTDDTNLRFLDDLMPWSDRVQRECPSLYKKS